MTLAAMTPRERLFAALSGQPTDRVPFWLLFPYHPASYYVDVRTHPAYRPIHEASLGKAIVLDRRSLRVPLFTPEVTTTVGRFEENGETVERRTCSRGSDRLYSERRTTPDGTTIKKLVDSEEDLEIYASFPLLEDEAEVDRQLNDQLPRYLDERKDFPAAYGAMMLDLDEPIGALYGSSNLEEYAIWSLTCPGVVEDFLSRVMRQRRMVYRWCLERELAETYFLVGSELASPPLVSRETFQRWVVPYARELIGMIHGAGAKVIQHYHGQIADILPDFVDMAPDALHTIEAPPTGNCTFTQAYAVTGDRITLIGNVQYDRFRAATPEEIRAETLAVIEECRGKRFILSPTAGPYATEAPERLTANFLAFMDAAWNARP